MHENTRMNNKTFDEFVSRQQETDPETNSIDWGKERDEWLEHLRRLYTKIESFLHKYVSSGQIRLEYRSIDLNEENIGTYSAEQMILRIGRQEVDLVPIGTLLIGSKGRVDVIGPAGKAEMLLVAVASKPASEVEWEWRIVTRPPERRFVEITQESLFQLIMEVANG